MWSPLQAIFDGVSSTLGRYLVAILLFFGGYATASPWSAPLLQIIPNWIACSFGILFEWVWAFSGLWVLIGIASIIIFLLFAVSYVYELECGSSISVFGMYTSSAIYFLPLSDDGNGKMWWVLLYYCLVCTCLWVLPWAVRRSRKRRGFIPDCEKP